MINFKVENAQTWSRELWSYVKSCNPLIMSSVENLQKLHTQLLLITHKPEADIPVNNIVKFFAKEKIDRKVVENALDCSGLPSKKNEMLKKDKFGFEQFKEFYLKLLIRDDVKQVYETLCKPEKEKSMSCHTFLTFLNQFQRDPRLNEILYPYATEEKAIFLIKKYEPNEHLSSQVILSSDWLTQLYSSL